MPKASYDVVIVGMDLPALVFGSLAAKRGYRVLVLGHGGKEVVYDVEGFHFVRQPNILFGFSDSPPIREAFRELALAPEMRNLPRPLAPTCSVILPDARIEVSHMKGIMEEEIAREFPGRLEAFRDLILRLPEAEKFLEPLLTQAPILPANGIREFFAYRRFRNAVKPLMEDASLFAGFGVDPRERAMLAAPLSVMSALWDPFTKPLAFVRLANHLLRGLYFVEWGLDSLKALFLERIRSNSGDVRPADYVDMLLVKRGRIHEVEVRARDEAIGVGVLAVGTRLRDCLDLIAPEQAKRRYHAKVEAIQPSHYLVTVNIGANREILPEGMARTAFVISDPSKPLEGENLLVLQVDPAMEPLDAVDPARTTIAVSAFLPTSRWDGRVSSLQAFYDSMLSTLKNFLPFFDEHKVVVSPGAVGIDPRTAEPVVDKSGLRAVYAETLPRSLDLMTWSVCTKYKNMLFLGDEVMGALGFEGAFFVAFMALERLQKLIHLKNVIA